MTTRLNPKHRSFRPAFTLIEILISITIIVVLAAISFIALKRLKEGASAAVDANDMRQIGSSVVLFASDNGDILPVTSSGVGPIYKETGKALSMRLAPYMGYDDVQDGHFMPEFASANWQSARTGDGNGPSLLVRQNVYTGNGKPKSISKPEPYCQPFGYPPWNGNRRDPMALSGAISKMGDPSNRLMLTEIDRLLPDFGNPGWADTVPEGMAHGSYRLGLYWDGHVGKLDVNLEPL